MEHHRVHKMGIMDRCMVRFYPRWANLNSKLSRMGLVHKLTQVQRINTKQNIQSWLIYIQLQFVWRSQSFPEWAYPSQFYHKFMTYAAPCVASTWTMKLLFLSQPLIITMLYKSLRNHLYINTLSADCMTYPSVSNPAWERISIID